MKKLTIKSVALIGCLLIAITMSSCEEHRQNSRYVCNCEQQKRLEEFVKGSIKNANNMSDEEMEDVIRELRIDGVMMICKQKPVWEKGDGTIDWVRQKYDSCEIIMDF